MLLEILMLLLLGFGFFCFVVVRALWRFHRRYQIGLGTVSGGRFAFMVRERKVT